MTTAINRKEGTRGRRTKSRKTPKKFPRTKTAATILAAIRAEAPLTPEQEQDFGRVARFVNRVANIKIVTLLAVACVVMGLALLAITTVTTTALLISTHQSGRIDTVNNKLTNVGTRLNEQQREIDDLLTQIEQLRAK